MERVMLFIVFFYTLSFCTHYDVVFKDRYEYGADSVIVLDSNNHYRSKFIYLRETNKIIELVSSAMMQCDTMSVYYLNSFGKPHILKRGSQFTRYDYANQNLMHVCSSTDTFFTNCFSESFIEYTNGFICKITTVAFTDSTTKMFSYNDSGDAISIHQTSNTDTSFHSDTICYDYHNETVYRWEVIKTTSLKSIIYYKSGQAKKIEQYINGKLHENKIFYYSGGTIGIVSVEKNDYDTSSMFHPFYYTLDGRRLKGHRFSSMLTINKNRKKIEVRCE